MFLITNHQKYSSRTQHIKIDPHEIEWNYFLIVVFSMELNLLGQTGYYIPLQTFDFTGSRVY